MQALDVTDGTLVLLRVQPVIGRRFTADDDSPKTPERVMLAYGYWQRKFGGDPDVIGRQIVIDGAPQRNHRRPARRISGSSTAIRMVVLPFRLNRAELFVGNFSFRGIARLKPGVTIAQANADVARMIPLVSERFPMAPGFTKQMFQEAHIGPNVRPLAQDVIGDVGRVLWVLLGTVGIVLLIACANVANLFLVRAEGRQQELAIHAALGAGSRRIAWELLSESLLLGVHRRRRGTAARQHRHPRASSRIAPDGLPRVQDIGIDPVVLLFTLAISLLAGAAVRRHSGHQVRHAAARLRAEPGRPPRHRQPQRHRARNALVVIEIALAVVLLVGSGLMIRTFQAMRSVDPGFVNPAQVLTMRISIPDVADQGSRADGAHVRANPAATRPDPGRQRPSASRRRWRWTASASTIRFSSRTSRDPAAGFRRSAGTR